MAVFILSRPRRYQCLSVCPVCCLLNNIIRQWAHLPLVFLGGRVFNFFTALGLFVFIWRWLVALLAALDSVWLSLCLPVCLFISLPICCLPVCLPVVCLPVALSPCMPTVVRGLPVAPREVSESLRALVYRAAPRGLTDSAEDVCAAAARAIRLVMKRFLPSSSLGALKAPPSPGAKNRDGGGGGGGSELREMAAIGKEDGGRGLDLRGGGGAGGGEGVFDLVWKALEDLDQDSTCVEVCRGCRPLV